MVTNRTSIVEHGAKLAEIVLNGDPLSAEATNLAVRLARACATGGSYKKKYEDPVERVLYRHLNLYRNKLKKAVTDYDRVIWRDKLRAQERKIAEYKEGQIVTSHVETPVELDLDGL